MRIEAVRLLCMAATFALAGAVPSKPFLTKLKKGGNSIQSHTRDQRATRNLLEDLLRDLSRGPLKGREVTLFLDASSSEKDIPLHQIPDVLGIPAFLFKKMNRTSWIARKEHIDVFVGVVGAELPWLLNSPPRDWSVPSVLLIGLKQECDPRALLQTALAQRTPAVAALCLAKLGEQRNKLEFRVFTWRPLHPRRKLLLLGGWNASRFASWDQLFVDRFSSFGGVTLHVASNTNEPPALFKTNSSQLDGLGYRILSTLAEKYNFNFTLTTTSSDGMWAENHKGVWKGMLGDVHRGEKNLTINTIYITYHQAAAFDFSIPFKYEGIGFVIAVPLPLPPWQSVVYPFTGTMWAGIAGLLVVVSLTYCLLGSFVGGGVSPFRYFLTIAQALVNQSNDAVPSPWTLRLFLMSWWFTAYIIAISYTCNLIAFLTIPKYPVRLETAQDLADSYHRVCMMNYGNDTGEFFAQSPNPALSTIAKKMDLLPLIRTLPYSNTLACLKLVATGTHAMLDGESYLTSVVQDSGYGDRMYFLKERINEGAIHFYFRKNTPWKHKFDEGMSGLLNSGFIGKWMDEINQMLKGKLYEKKPEGQQALRLEHLQGTFLVLAVGWCLALVTFLAERRLGGRERNL